MPEPSVRLVDDPQRVGSAARDWLETQGVHANVPATILASELAGPRRYDDQSWAVAEAGGAVVGVAVHTPPFHALLPPVGPAVAVGVAQAWHAVRRPLPGVIGNAEAGGAFTRRWSDLTGAAPVVEMREGVHVLGEFTPADGVPGAGRAARPDDLGLIVAWLGAFLAEAMPGHPEVVDAEAELARVRRGHYLVWEDREPVSLAAIREPAGGLGRIGPVYTPPAHRGRGYAAAVTTLASRRVLAAGARPMLHTDLANATSNGVYARLGYEQVGELTRWTFG